MKLKIVRDSFNDTTTLGKLFIDDVYQCETLEDTDRKLESGGVKVDGKSCIPRGSYKVIIDYSNKFKREMPHILDVPKFEGIRIHSGNTAEDTEGCILLGKSRTNDRCIGSSREAFRIVFDVLETAYEKNEEITIDIK